MAEKIVLKNIIKNKTLIFIGLITITSLCFGLVFGFGIYKLKEKVGDKVENLENKVTNVEEQSATIDVVKKVSPSVVSITSEQSTLNFFGQVSKSQSAGTGFIVTKDGLIITNKHVVSSAIADYSVFTSDGKEYKAKVKAIDSSFDIAFLQIEADNLTPVELGDSNSIQVGQKAIAIGNALGQYQNTVTVGVISAVGRAIEAGDSSGYSSETLENMIQTDAAINPGNSGGPLVNIAGQVIGINTAVDAEAQGIGFAIPINLARTALKSVIEKGRVIRPMLGVRYINITKEFATRNNLSTENGALIYSSGSDLAVIPNSPASKAGLKEGDILIKINDDVLGQGKSLISLLSKYEPGNKINITYIRDGKESKTTAVLTESK